MLLVILVIIFKKVANKFSLRKFQSLLSEVNFRWQFIEVPEFYFCWPRFLSRGSIDIWNQMILCIGTALRIVGC